MAVARSTPPLRSIGIPLYVRAGSIVPLGPDQEWSTREARGPDRTARLSRRRRRLHALRRRERQLQLRERAFTQRFPFHWDDAEHALTIGDRKGQFPGMLESRTFRVVFVGENHGVGIDADRQTRQGCAVFRKANHCDSVERYLLEEPCRHSVSVSVARSSCLLLSLFAAGHSDFQSSTRATIRSLSQRQIPGQNAILMGSAWYPEQWPEARWEEDLRLMEAARSESRPRRRICLEPDGAFRGPL